MDMNNEEEVVQNGKTDIRAIELLGMLGFSLFFGWMLICFFWFFAGILQDISAETKNVYQIFVFLGVVVGYLSLHVAGRSIEFNPFEKRFLIGVAVMILILPAVSLVFLLRADIPIPILCVANFVCGVAGACAIILWLDTCSRLNVEQEYRFVSMALFFGSVLMALAMLMPLYGQVAFSALYGLGTVVLLGYVNRRAHFNEEARLVEAETENWKFTREIEPLMVAFGMVFGLSFVYLFNFGGITLVVGLLFVCLGSGIIVVLSLAGVEIGITILERIILCVTVTSCVVTPFAPDLLQLIAEGCVVMSWAALLSVNCALLVRKAKADWTMPAFKQVPLRLFFRAFGFFLGWGAATAIGVIFGAHHHAYIAASLAMVVILVIIFAFCMPEAYHHDKRAMEEAALDSGRRVVSAEVSESELFEAKCQVTGKKHGLSPREIDILIYLARGRNVAYLQEKFCISPHTVKSHIYSIYRKYNIHSQQKLMDYIEEYALNSAELAAFQSKGSN